MFRLYYISGICALATHIVLEEAGAPYETVLVDFHSQAQRSPEPLAVNPKGRVPVLATESGTLTKTPALLFFVAPLFPNAELASSQNRSRSHRFRSSTVICSMVHVAHGIACGAQGGADNAA
ncbi:MAG: glutathione S-transferase N-terminal domain-containing protein [Alphaproteobacteria bacterium]|nr:glutathione S-transferase N-terminal domain-containing protein [Alphaproteobacteria bacterium]